MTKEDILNVPEGYTGPAIEWKTNMLFKYVKEVLETIPNTLENIRYLKERYGIYSTDLYFNTGSLIINNPIKFDLDGFYDEYGPTKGSIERDNTHKKKLKVDKLKKLTCECCNGTLDPSTIKDNIIKCEFCGTKYIVE